MKLKRILLTLLLAGISAAGARIGLEAAPVLAEMAADESFAAAESFSYDAETYGGLLFALSGIAGSSDADADAIGAAAGYATGFGKQIAAPVADFLRSNLDGLLEAGQASVPVEGNFMLDLDVSADEDGEITIVWAFGLGELDTDLFLPVRHALGADADSARVIIREFADMQCPHCANFSSDVMPQIRELLAEDSGLRFEFHHMPLVTIHANAIPAAEALECVADVNGADSFWEFGNTIFERMQAWAVLPETGPYFISLASEQGFDTAGMSECLDNRDHLEYIRASYDNAVQHLGVTGTPTTFVDGIRVGAWNAGAAYEELITLLDARNTEP